MGGRSVGKLKKRIAMRVDGMTCSINRAISEQSLGDISELDEFRTYQYGNWTGRSEQGFGRSIDIAYGECVPTVESLLFLVVGIYNLSFSQKYRPRRATCGALGEWKLCGDLLEKSIEGEILREGCNNSVLKVSRRQSLSDTCSSKETITIGPVLAALASRNCTQNFCVNRYNSERWKGKPQTQDMPLKEHRAMNR